jgi:hypothetical protein
MMIGTAFAALFAAARALPSSTERSKLFARALSPSKTSAYASPVVPRVVDLRTE